LIEFVAEGMKFGYPAKWIAANQEKYMKMAEERIGYRSPIKTLNAQVIHPKY